MEKKRKIIRTLFLFTMLLMLSCSEDLYEKENPANKNHSILVQRKNFEDLKKDKKLIKSIEKFTLTAGNSFQRQHYDSVNNFYIDLDDVMFTKDSLNNQAYTFKINRIPNNGLFENLILKSNNLGGFDAILAQYNQTALSLIPNDQVNSLEIINQNVNFIYLGQKNLNDINNRIQIRDMCYDGVFVWQQGESCASGQHAFGEQCDYLGTNQAATPGDYVYSMTSVPCEINEANSFDTFSTGPHGFGFGNGSDDPCAKLKDLFNPAKANIKPTIINDLRPNIAVNPSGEKGASLAMNSSGVVTNTIIPPVSQPPIQIPTGGIFYSAIHTHPLDTAPMFSWSDVYVLNKMNNNLATHNQGLASFLLVCQDDNNVFQTYAIVFDPNSFNENIDQFMTNPENIGCSEKEITEKKNEELRLEYNVEYNSANPNYEKVFLKKMFNSNVSLYKANGTLTNWSKLSISSNTTNPTINSTNCN